MTDQQLYAWQMTAAGEPFQLNRLALPEVGSGEALLKVAGCGVCHTDLSFWHFGVKTRKELPLTLGHEISATVVKGPRELIGRPVIVPAVLPCGDCDLCRRGHSNICRRQLMPGNDFDGGFASHVKVPARFLCPIPDKLLKTFSLAELAVVADAVSTPYQVVERSGLEAGDFAVVVGVGGIGIYGAQIARQRGAMVMALDISDEKLQMAAQAGIEKTLNIRDLDPRAVKEAVKAAAQAAGTRAYGWKIYEMSGTRAGQELAFSLLGYEAVMSVVGFTMEKPEVRLSNLMAFDARLIGTWGCRAELYPEILALIADGSVLIKPFVQTFPMSQINQVFSDTLQHRHLRRAILIPDFDDA